MKKEMLVRMLSMLVIAAMAIVPCAIASFEVEINYPVDGQIFHVGDSVNVRCTSTAYDEEMMYGRMLLNGVPTGTSHLVFTEPGEYVITAQLAGTSQFINAVEDSVTVTVLAAQPKIKPVVVRDYYPTVSRTEQTIVDAPGILANDIGSNLQVFEPENIVLSKPSAGTIEVSEDGSFVFTPAPGVGKGAILFYYKITNGESVSAPNYVKLVLV